MALLKVGQPLPEFKLQSQDGSIISPQDHQGKKNLVIYFYPADFTSGCTKEACSFRDYERAINDKDAVIMGISKDSVDSHRQFAESLGLNYTLLSDESGEVARMFGVTKLLGILGGRVTFVADKQGIIRKVFESRINFTKHVSEALAALNKMH